MRRFGLFFGTVCTVLPFSYSILFPLFLFTIFLFLLQFRVSNVLVTLFFIKLVTRQCNFTISKVSFPKLNFKSICISVFVSHKQYCNTIIHLYPHHFAIITVHGIQFYRRGQQDKAQIVLVHHLKQYFFYFSWGRIKF